ncbi:MAG: T9SS type A sorting domain-containing protein, partial [Ignavibacteria bacterium]|nr:T9SS type A sorting domain-containing protein [Ignavibacteria bacterium]
RTTNDGVLWEEVTGELPFFSDFRDVINVNEKVMIATGSGIFSRPESQLTNVQSNLSTMPDKFSLEQNYPNPFNPTTKIRFELPKSSFISLKVYNSSGKEVDELINGKLSAGIFEETFNASKLSSGVYFYKLTTDEFVETKKMLLVK